MTLLPAELPNREVVMKPFVSPVLVSRFAVAVALAFSAALSVYAQEGSLRKQRPEIEKIQLSGRSPEELLPSSDRPVKPLLRTPKRMPPPRSWAASRNTPKFIGDGFSAPAPLLPAVACSSTINLTPNVTYSGSLALGGANNVNGYAGCTAFDEPGPDKVHKVTLTAVSTVTFTLDWPSSANDLDLYILTPTCDSTFCAGSSTSSTGNTESVTLANATAGDYYVVVEDWSNVTTTYNLTADVAENCLNLTTIGSGEIGTTLTGDTRLASNNISYYAGLSYWYGGPELAYKYTIPSDGKTHDLRAYLEYDSSQVDLDVLILGSPCNSAEWLNIGDYAVTYPSAPAGDYYIVVDTYTGLGAPSSTGGPFQLTVADASGLLLVDHDGSGATCSGTAWQASHVYAAGAVVQPTSANGHLYRTDSGGVSYSSEPTWPTSTGSMVADGSVTWTETLHPTTDVQSYWTTALTTIAESYTLVDTGSGCSPVSLGAAQLNNSRNVVWFSGSQFQDGAALTASDRTRLTQYLNLGGRLILEGDDLLFDVTNGVDGRIPDGNVMNDFAAVDTVDNDIDKACHTCPASGGTSGSYSISGSVMNNPLGSARTICYSGPKQGSVAGTAANPSVYSISNLPNGTYTLAVVCACANGCGAGPDTWKITVAGANVTNVNFQYTPGRNLTGAIGNPIGANGASTYAFTLAAGTPIGEYTDALSSRYGEPVFYTKDNRPAAVMHDGSNSGIPWWYKTVFLAFSPPNDATASRMSGLLQRSLAWLRDDSLCNFDGHVSVSADFVNVTDGTKKYPRPGDTVTFPVHVLNLGATSVALRTYYTSLDPYMTLTSPAIGYADYGTVAPVQDWRPSTAYAVGNVVSSPSSGSTWQASHSYSAGTGVWPTNPNGHFYYSTGAGTSGTSEPVWPTTSGGTVVDNTVTWKEHISTGWSYRCTVAGMSGTASPSWSSYETTGTTLISGTATFVENSQNFTFTISSLTPKGYRILPDFAVHEGGSYCAAQGFGLFVDMADVLLVKDEIAMPNTTGVDVYDQILAGLGYSRAIWDTASFGAPFYSDASPGAIANDQMKNYPIVVWETGFDWYWTLTPDPWEQSLGVDPEAELRSYLTSGVTGGNGGRLILSSQDYFWDRYGACGTSSDCVLAAGDFAFDKLLVSSFRQDVVKQGSALLDGKPRTWPTELSLNTLGETWFTNYSDSTVLRGGFSDGRTWGTWRTVSDLPTGTGYLEKTIAAPAGKFVFLPFAFENIVDNGAYDTKANFIQRILCQMQMTPASTSPSCAWNKPAPFSADVVIRGNKVSGNAVFGWGDMGKYDCPTSRPVWGQFRVRGKLNNPNTATWSSGDELTRVWPPLPSYTGTQSVTGSGCFFYEVDTYADDFGVLAGTCP
jgi:hypothetical protein